MRWLALLLLCGCTDDAVSKAERFPAPDGNWYPGDFHVHATGASNDTGGDSFPEDIAAVARARGLYFVVLTDHSNSTGSDVTTTEEDPALFNQGPEFPYWEKAAELSVPDEFVMIDGNEVSPIAAGETPSEPRGHIGCTPEDLDAFDRSGAFVDRPRGDVSGGEALAQALDRGCFAVLNHPYSLPHISYDWTSFDYNAVEVFNGTLGLDGLDLAAHAAWRCDLVLGRDVVPVGGSDCHRHHIEPPGQPTHPALGYPTTAVRASDGSWPAIMAGLKSGDVAIYEGESRLYLDGYDETPSVASGDDIRILRLHGFVDPLPGPTARLTLTRATACDDTRPGSTEPPSLTEDVLLEQDIDGGAAYDLEVTIAGEPGVYSAILRAAGQHYSALSRAIVIR